ncbi:MFS transporter [Bradyrhizobium sp. Arg237L]|uniref:MFS transporter n=1 Tax=Bradyrhizobium sp. Arg237L TaxID=3003352 RepID=UPI00249E5128|nr:MFS transporter [Bradyrhizobium sp. Arg237L]MDI4232591.1 MFS transporter [Bradyrhizobium sp. Arg237L]
MSSLVEVAPRASVNAEADYVRSGIELAKWRIVPFLFLCFILNYIDRTNVAFAKLHFQKDLGFTDAVYGFGVSLFFAGFLLFEVPSNLLLARIGARKTLARIMILWGIVSVAMMFIKTPTHFYLGRFLLGAAEAGFVPGVVLYLSFWFPSTLRARITSLFMAALPISGIISNPISGLIMDNLGGAFGLASWQWLFLLEGLPSIVVGVVALWYLADRPKAAKWLSDPEKDAIASSVEREEQGKQAATHHGFGGLLSDPRIYVFAFAVFTQYAVANTFAFWGPSILRGSGVANVWYLGLLNAVPFVAGVVMMTTVAWRSDKKMERRWHAAFGQALSVVGLVLLPAGVHDPFLAVVSLALVASGHYAFWSVFWTIPPSYFRARSAPGGIALVASIGALGGIFASNLMGMIKDATGSFSAGFYGIAALAALGVVVLLVGFPARLLPAVKAS